MTQTGRSLYTQPVIFRQYPAGFAVRDKCDHKSHSTLLDSSYRKLHPALAEKLANTATAQPLRVIIWLKETSQSEASRPAPNPGNTLRASEAQVNDFFKQVDARRAAAVQPIVNSAVNKLRSLGTNVSTEKYSPGVYANLTPQAIAQVATWNEVDQIYKDQKAKPTLDIARHTILADVVQSRGRTGSGVQVGEIEVGEQPHC